MRGICYDLSVGGSRRDQIKDFNGEGNVFYLFMGLMMRTSAGEGEKRKMRENRWQMSETR